MIVVRIGSSRKIGPADRHTPECVAITINAEIRPEIR